MLSQIAQKFKLALDLNKEAWNIRVRLRDPRMMAQSEVRIAQCELGMVRIALKKGDKDVQKLIEDAEKLAASVEDRYKEMPQEQFRKDDVMQIRAEAMHLRKKQRTQKLLRLAEIYNIAVVVTNHVQANPAQGFGDP